MNVQNIFRLTKLYLPKREARYYSYKTITRPDPSKMKMPNVSEGPKILEIIRQKIKLNGPISVAEYMNIVAHNPTEGYYTKKDVIGARGDFITSPEISQLFGEILAVWFYAETKKMGLPKPLQLVELGPGKATLLIDMLRVINHLGYKEKDLSLHLVEVAPTMQHIQANKLCIAHKSAPDEAPHYHEGETMGGSKVYWYRELKHVPEEFSWFVAHEFFDALPVHKFEKTADGWREILIDIQDDGKLFYRMSGEDTNAMRLLLRPPLDTGDRTELEVSARALGLARQLAQRVDKYGGLALICDYGHEGEKGDTFRAFYNHTQVDPLLEPGKADLTADVDFTQLRIAASKTALEENYAITAGPVTQRDFLLRMQANVRLQVLLDNAKEENKAALQSGYEMLTDPRKMGDRFKFLAFYPSAMSEFLDKYPPLGFTETESSH